MRVFTIFLGGVVMTGTSASVWGLPKTSLRLVNTPSEPPSSHHSALEVNLIDRFSELVNGPIYAQAVAELMELEKKTTCSRQATRHFMDLCKNHENYPSYSAKESELQIEFLEGSYVVSLAICEFKMGRIDFPSECLPFEIGSWDSPMADRLNYDQLEACISNLNKEATQWISFSNMRQRAAILRHATRYSIEKEELIEVLKKGTRVHEETIATQIQLVNSLTTKMDVALANLANGIDTHEAEMRSFTDRLQSRFSSFIANLMGDLSTVTSKVLDSLTAVLNDVENVSSVTQTNLQEIQKASIQVRESQQDLVVGAQNNLEAAFNLRDLLILIKSNMESVNAHMDLMQRRQDEIERQAVQSNLIMANLTEQLKSAASLTEDNAETLERASRATSDLVDGIEKAQESVTNWSNLGLGSSGPFGTNPTLFIACPVMTVILGSYGVERMIQGIALASIGVTAAKILTLFNNCDWRSNLWKPTIDLAGFAQGNRGRFTTTSIVTEPVSFDPEDLNVLSL